jgi:hypothetical protein
VPGPLLAWTVVSRLWSKYGALLTLPLLILAALIAGRSDFGRSVDLAYYRTLAGIIPTFLIAFILAFEARSLAEWRDIDDYVRLLQQRPELVPEWVEDITQVRSDFQKVIREARFVYAVPVVAAVLAEGFALVAIAADRSTTFLFVAATANAGMVVLAFVHDFFSGFPTGGKGRSR